MSANQKCTCPCCGFLAFDNPPGSYDICEYCGWEDDGVQLANPCSPGGANQVSLCDAQTAFRATTPGADIDEWITMGAERDLNWRPLNNVEKQLFRNAINRQGPWSQKAITQLADAYWNRNIVREWI
jgi:hypothetical protein